MVFIWEVPASTIAKKPSQGTMPSKRGKDGGLVSFTASYLKCLRTTSVSRLPAMILNP